jgi:2-desacetyl-2-hydroxyethyl bacteriochlorophyllide A dehydrogenase
LEKHIRQLWFTDKFTIGSQKITVRIDDHQLLVRNLYSLISPGTELALYTGTHIGFTDPDIAWARYPIQPGYASVGIVEKGDPQGIVQAGKRILHCSPHSSHAVLDPDKDMFLVLDEGINEKAALFAKLAQISATAVNLHHICPSSVLVFGAGLIGNLCAQLYQLKGFNVILAEISETRLEIARQCEVRKVLNPTDPDFRQQLKTLTNGCGINLVVEATGVPAVVNQSLELVNEYGEVLLLGSTRGTVAINVYKLIHRKKVILAGAHESYFPTRSAVELSQETIIKENLTFIAKDELKVEPLISYEVVPSNVKSAYEGLLHEKEKYLGVIINWMKEE